MNFSLLMFFLLLTNFSYAKTLTSFSQARLELQKTQSRDLIEWINGLIKASAPSRMIGMPGHEKAVEFLETGIKGLDPKSTGKISLSSFPLGSQEGKNLIWEKSGSDTSKMLLITAHYDTASSAKSGGSMPGANFNASGVAVALGLIKTLSLFDFKSSVQVVFLDGHTRGLSGSLHHAKSLNKEIIGVINLERLGQDTISLDKSKKTGNMVVYSSTQPKEMAWIEKLLQFGKRTSDQVNFEIRPEGSDKTDSISFREKGFLSATFSQNREEDFNPKFHKTPHDTPETLNQRTLYNSFQFIGGAVLGVLSDLTK